MNLNQRPLRSVLFVPGNNNKAISKIKVLESDAFILDLEDALSPNLKIQGRANAIRRLHEGGFNNKYIMVRINNIDSELGRSDLHELSSVKFDGLVLPKVESKFIIDEVKKILHYKERYVDIWCMIETPKGVGNINEIASSSIDGLIMGTSDLTKELNAGDLADRSPLLYSLSSCLLSAKIHNKIILDGVFLDINNLKGFEKQCIQGNQMGFNGKTLIHPKTIDITNKIYGVSEKQLNYAKDIIKIYNEALSKGESVVLYKGKLIENLHIEQANSLLEKANIIKNMNGI